MKTTHKIAIIVLIGMLVRTFLIIYFQTYKHPVAWEYEQITLNMIGGKGFMYHHLGGVEYRSSSAPMYVFICAGLYLLFGHVFLPVLTFQMIMSAFVAFLIYKIGKKLFSEKTGLLAAILVTLHPGLVYYDVFNLIPMSLDIFFIVLLAYVVVRAGMNISPLMTLAMGVIIGMGSLTRNIIGTLGLSLSVYIAIFFRQYGFKRIVMLIVCIFSGMILVISPWLVRNYIIHKKIIFASTSGENLWRGNNKFATGTLLSKNGTDIIDLWPREFRDKVYALDEIGQKELFEREAGTFIHDHPFLTARLYLKKLYYFWWFSPQSGILYQKYQTILYKLYYAVLLMAFIPGLIISLRKNAHNYPGVWVLVFICAGIALTQSFFYAEGRHRWIIEPILILFAASGLMRIKLKLNED